ncbi:MAG: S8 family serine peptidase [Betaproteobacteria bacterium]
MRFAPIRAILATAALGCMMAAGGAAAAMIGEDVASSDSVITPAALPPGLGNAEMVVMAKLTGAPVAERQGLAGRRLTAAEKAQAKQQLKAQQDALLASIEALGGTVLGQYQSAYNGIKVRIARDKLAALAALPGVVAVKPVPLMMPNNVRSVPFIGAPTVWQDLALHGEGVKVAIIDTGIDYTHANFGGPGTAAAYTAAHAAEAQPADPALFGPSAPRVKGGIDLVGDAYSGGAASIAHPDANPLDCNGHGSHVAGTAAGSGVKADGTTYTGPYDATTIGDPRNWTIGPGVAPKADLYAVRVFGCTGGTRFTVDAIDWAVDNDMDVINMSLGSPFGTADDPSAEAATNAAKAGIVVVASAGNNGLAQYITGSPASGDGAISVAANDPTATFPGALVATPGGSVSTIDANDYPLPPVSTYTLKVLTGAGNLGCSVADFGGPLPPNTMVVVQRGVCARVAKAIFGQQAGAAAVLMVNNATGFPPFEGPITSNPDDGVPFTVTIPFLGASSTANPTLSAANGAVVTVTPATIANPTFKAFASFTSGGPRNGDSALKPEITAPGVSIASTLVGSGNGAEFLSGTSMAAPHVTGAAALTRQAHMGWTVDDIKAAMVGTASPAGVAGFRVSTGGTGLVQPAGSTATQVVARPNGDRFAASVNFGYSELANDFKATRAIKLANNGGAAATFNVAQATPAGRPHAVAFDTTTVTVPPHASAVVNVTLTVPAATAGSADGSGLSFREVAGLVEFTPATAGDNAGVALRVPYYLVPRGVSTVSTALGKPSADPDPVITASITNKLGTIAGTADFYAWGIAAQQTNNGLHSTRDTSVTNDVRAVGVQSFPSPSSSNPTRRLIVFAVNTWNRWSSPSTNEFDISVDVDGDGVDDYVVVGVDEGLVLAGEFNGVMRSFVFSTRSPGASSAFRATAPTDSSIAELPVLSTQLCRANEPCLSVNNPRFTYNIASFDLRNGGVDAPNAVGRFNPWTNAVSTGAFATVAPGASASGTVTVNTAESALTPALGVMVVNIDNRTGAEQASLLPIK